MYYDMPLQNDQNSLLLLNKEILDHRVYLPEIILYHLKNHTLHRWKYGKIIYFPAYPSSLFLPDLTR